MDNHNPFPSLPHDYKMKQNPMQAAFSHLLLSGTLVHEASFSQMQKELEIAITPTLVMVVSIDRYPEVIFGKELSYRMEVGRNTVESVYEAVTLPFVWVWVAEGVLAILLEVPAQRRESERIASLTGRLARLIQRKSDERDLSVSIGIGSYYDDPYSLHCSYEEALDSMIDRFFQGNRLIFQYRKEQPSDKEWQESYIQLDRTELLARMRVCDSEGAIEVLRCILEKMAEAYKHNVRLFKSGVLSVLMDMLRLVLQSGADASDLVTENLRVTQDLYTTIRYNHFVDKVCIYGRALIEKMELESMATISPVIRDAIHYVRRHHQQPLTLKTAAQYCCLSTYYFSHLFKKETGYSFIHYVNKVRIEKSLFYLQSSDYTIQEIAEKVGFTDANYFSRTFKKYYQVTPSAYKQQFRAN